MKKNDEQLIWEAHVGMNDFNKRIEDKIAELTNIVLKGNEFKTRKTALVELSQLARKAGGYAADDRRRDIDSAGYSDAGR